MSQTQNVLPLPLHSVAALLDEIGKRMELVGESPFKIRAYYVAAENLVLITTPLEELIAKGKLKEIPGVGEAIAEKIIKLHKTGTHPTLEFLREQFPAGVLDLLKIPGLGPKKAAALYQSLKISSLAELESACRDGLLAKEKGFGAKFQDKILEGLAFERKNVGLLRIDAAHDRARAACEALKSRVPSFKEVLAAGSVRRACEVVGGLDLVAVCDSEPPEPLESSADISVTIALPERLGTALLFVTGNSEHVNALRSRATARGLELTPEGLRRGSEELPCADEAEIYAALGLPYIEPELREGLGEIERAERSAQPRLIEESDLRGILHCHTDFSDGSNTLVQMAETVRKLGQQYFGVCDHSQSAAYARGMRFEKVRAQHQLADDLNRQYEGKRFRILKGIESDILEHGELDYSDEQLPQFDFIVASVHSRFQLSKKDQTARIVNAVKNPFTTILGHPTGRLLLQRESYEVDVDEILKACAEHGVAVEINADPHRLDLDWRWHGRALELGCMLSINPDAHDTGGFLNQKWGVLIARKGGVPAERVLNCLDLPAIDKHFAERRKKR
ncbi:MAG TPA: PHP domain-containing protein [Planctomycetota bacterium]|nr:PHP domain-containing protein [Planctomycetota bacterium]